MAGNTDRKVFGILGVGKMGGAILDGVLASGVFPNSDIMICDHKESTRMKYSALGIGIAQTEKELLDKSDIFMLAIKPQGFSAIEALSGTPCAGKAIISLAPGKKVSFLESFFKGALVVRAMPNTPALVRNAATTLFANGKGDVGLLEWVKRIFSSIGTFEFLEKEEMIDIAIPVNGSMPAYLFSFVREFVEKAVQNGIDRQTAMNLCVNSIIGSCKLLQSSDDGLDTLISNVCSKGGTTIAGLDSMYGNGFKESIGACYDACVARSLELAK